MAKDFKMDTRINWFHGFKRVLYEHKPMNQIGEDDEDIKSPSPLPITDLPEPIHPPTSSIQLNYPSTQWKQNSLSLNQDRIPLLSEKHLENIPENCLGYVNDMRKRIMKLERENTDLRLYVEDGDNEHAMLLRETKMLRKENAKLQEELEFQKKVLLERSRYKGSNGRVTRVNRFRFGEPLTDDLPPTLDKELKEFVDQRLQVIDKTGTPRCDTMKDRHLDHGKTSFPSSKAGNRSDNEHMKPSSRDEQLTTVSKLPRPITSQDRSFECRKISIKKPIYMFIPSEIEPMPKMSKIPVRIKSSVQTSSMNDKKGGKSKSCNVSKETIKERRHQITNLLPPLRIQPGEKPRKDPKERKAFTNALPPLKLRPGDIPKQPPPAFTFPKIKSISTGEKSKIKLSQKIKAEPLPNRLKNVPKLPRI